MGSGCFLCSQHLTSTSPSRTTSTTKFMSGKIKPFSPGDETESSRLRLALQSGGIGTWQFNILTNTFLWSDQSKILFRSHPINDDLVSIETILNLVHGEDRALLRESLVKSFNVHEDKDYEIEFRLNTSIEDKNGWLMAKGQVYFDKNGNPEKLVGIVQDITRQTEASQQNRQLSKTASVPGVKIKADNTQKDNNTVLDQLPVGIATFLGEDLIIDNSNDQLLKIWQTDRSIIGKPSGEVFTRSIHQHIQSNLTEVYRSGKKIYERGILVEIGQKDHTITAFYDFTYSPLRDYTGNITGVITTASDVTEHLTTVHKHQEGEERYRLLIQEAPVATGVFTGKDHNVSVANDKMIGYWGKDKSVIGKPVSEAIPEIKGQPFNDLLDEVFNTGITYSAKSAPADLVVDGVLSTYYFDYTYKPLRNANGDIYGVLNMAQDVTAEVETRRSLEASELKLRSVFANASAALALFVGRDLVIELANQVFTDTIGKGSEILNRKLSDVIPELTGQASLRMLQEVFDTGKPSQRFESQVNLLRDGVMTSNYYNVTYTPLFNEMGDVYAVLDIGIDVTEAVLARQNLEESELFARSIISNSPVAKLVFIGENMVIRTANENMLAMLGKDDSIIGKPFMEAVPELVETPLMNRLRDVLHTGASFNQPEEKIELLHHGEPYTGYYNYNYKVLRNTSGENYGVLVTAIEVTAQVVARQKIEEAEQVLRDAVELAELATWSVDTRTGQIGYGERMKQWIGVKEDERDFDIGTTHIPDKDRERIVKALKEATRPEGSGIYDEEHLIENVVSGQRRYIHSRAKTFFDQDHKPYKLIGIAQDITEQREVQLTLEQLVQQRTEELETMNEELAAINEEYMATNEDLSQSNHLLIQSNQSLQQFAYVASHDLQEPLRKIQSFGNLLFNRYAETLGDGANLIHRMQAAAARMSGLIEDLLTFSRISNQIEASGSVSLTEVVQHVLSDLELTIQEIGAVITIKNLPVIVGDDSQLGQLFQNLLSNALKFRQKGQTPVIDINCKIVSFSDLPLMIKPAQIAHLYYQIDVADNGIGFEQKYSERIFQLFQRLHGRSEFAGTGIGLSICERVAANHGGAICAVSELGKGSTFSIYLPI